MSNNNVVEAALPANIREPEATAKTKSLESAEEVSALLRARNPLIWIVTREEARVERYVLEAAVTALYIPRTWDVAAGIRDVGAKPKVWPENSAPVQDPGKFLEEVEKAARSEKDQFKGVWIARDLPVWFQGPIGLRTLRQMRNLVRLLPGTPLNTAQCIIIISPSSDVPPELSTNTMVVDWPLPDRKEVGRILSRVRTVNKLTSKEKETAIDAALGLSGEEIAACYTKSVVQYQRVDPVAVSKEKKRVISRERVLEWIDPLAGGLDAVGGLELLKGWLIARSSAYTLEARNYGLPAPKGVFLVGISGCGKSLTAKAVSTAFGCPLLRLDINALKSKFMGESEGNIRKALSVIEAIGRCVVWIDEIEKALQGATTESADGGVSADALGTILSWMQERRNEAFVIATANDIDKLPPELLRKGRFDELFFIDLPNKEERIAVLQAALRFHGRDYKKLDLNLNRLAKDCNQFTGAEIAALVPEAMFWAFNDGKREITTEDLEAVAKTVVPLSKTAADKIAALRAKAQDRFRPATLPPGTDPLQLGTVASETREIDMGEDE